jgi:hypothetical protein
MKKLLTIIVLITFPIFVYSQTQSADLDHNNSRIKILNGGDFFWDGSSAGYEVPKTDDVAKHTIFSGGLWIGGIDQDSSIHLAAMTYRQRGKDYYCGPVSDSQSITNQNFDKLWIIERSIVIQHLQEFQTNDTVSNPDPQILNWPAHGNHYLGEPNNLAPFVDLNSNDIYEPHLGDYPDFPGEKAIYTIYNDNGPHTESQGTPFKFDIHQMFYQEALGANQGAFDQLNLAHFKIVNRSNNTYKDIKVGIFVDFELGNYRDDYVGCDSLQNMIFTYNSDDNDEGVNGYGLNPPAQNVMFLNKRLYAAYRFGNNNNSINGSPTTKSDYLNALMAQDKIGRLTMHPKGHETRLMFSGSPAVDTQWSMNHSAVGPSDHRMIATAEPFSLAPGESECIDVAFVFVKPTFGGAIQAVNSMKQLSSHVQYAYNQNVYGWKPENCNGNFSSVKEIESRQTKIYPNPTTGYIYIDGDIEDFTLINSLGAAINHYKANTRSINLKSYPSGIYFIVSDQGARKILKL